MKVSDVIEFRPAANIEVIGRIIPAMVVVIVGKTIDEEIDITVADREIFCKNLRDAIDRSKFSGLVSEIGAKEAKSFNYSNAETLTKIAEELNFHCIIRPSSVIGGRGMAIIQSASELQYYTSNEKSIASGIINPLLENATEFDIDLLQKLK